MIWIVIWAVGALLSFRPVFRALYASDALGVHTWGDFAYFYGISLILSAVFWPALWAWIGLKAIGGRLTRNKDPRAAAQRIAGQRPDIREQKLLQREYELHALARELGVEDESDSPGIYRDHMGRWQRK